MLDIQSWVCAWGRRKPQQCPSVPLLWKAQCDRGAVATERGQRALACARGLPTASMVSLPPGSQRITLSIQKNSKAQKTLVLLGCYCSC